MTNAQAIGEITDVVNDRLFALHFDAGPPAFWRSGTRCVRLAEVGGILVYMLAGTGTAKVVHAGDGGVTKKDVAAAAEAIVLALRLPGDE